MVRNYPKIPIARLEPLHTLGVLDNQPEFLNASSYSSPSTKLGKI